jgi:hypothetical protein
MKNRLARTVLVASLLTSVTWAQGGPKTLTSSQAVLESWNDVGRKLIAMAEDFPEDKYDFKPVPAQRSFAEQLLHAAGSNDLFTAVAKGPLHDQGSRSRVRKEIICRWCRGHQSQGRRGDGKDGCEFRVA